MLFIDKIRRVTRDGRWIPEIDGLRFFAIISVFLFHLYGEVAMRSGRILVPEPRYAALFRFIANGDRGVRLFFVISGMILALPFARHALAAAQPVSLRKYYLRRLTRLEPPYILAMILFIFLSLGFVHFRVEPGYTSHALASLFYLHNLAYGALSPVNPVTWSLEVEIQFYLLAPLVMLLFNVPGRSVRRAVLVLLVIACGFLQLPFATEPRFQLSILFYIQYFLAGLLLADIFVLDLPTLRSHWLWDLVGFTGLAYFYWANHDSRTAHVVLPFIIALVCLAAMRSFALRRIVANTTIAVIGGMCYSIYLLHFMIMAAFFKVTRRLIGGNLDFLGNYVLQFVLLAAVTLVISFAFYLLVERPCMDPDWPSKLYHWLTPSTRNRFAALDSAGVGDAQNGAGK